MLILPDAVHTIYSTFHPAYAMRGMPQMWPSIHQTVSRAKRASLAPTSPATRAFTFNLDPTPDELRAYLARGPEFGVAAVDVETPRDEYPVKTIHMCGVSIAPYTAIVFPWTPPFVEIMRPFLASPAVVKVGHNFTFDQMAFMANDADVAWPIVNTIDSEALVRPPFKEAKDRRWLALASCLPWYYDGIPYWKDSEDAATRAFYRAAFPDVPDGLHERLYCGLDVIYNRLLWIAQRKALEKAGMLRVFTQYVAPISPVLARMEYRGLPVDAKRRDMLLDHLDKQITALTEQIHEFTADAHARRVQRVREAVAVVEKEIDAILKPSSESDERDGSAGGEVRRSDFDAGPANPCEQHPDFRGLTRRAKCGGCVRVYEGAPGLRARLKDARTRAAKGRARIKSLGEAFKETSDDHWRWLLFTETEKGGLGLVPIDFTEKKKMPKVDDESIEALQRAHPEILILTARIGLQHALHTQGVLQVPVDANGRAHFAFSQHRTETQRLASGKDEDEDDKTRGAVAGNVQNKKDLERSIFCAGHEDFVFVTWDLKQIELWDMAWLARDMDLLRALYAGRDIHSMNAAAIFGCPEDRDAADSFMVPFEGQMRSARYASKRYTHGTDYGMGDKKAGKMYQPCSRWPLTQVAEFIVKRWTETQGGVGISPDTVRRLHRSGDPVAHARLYEYANTAMAHGWRMAYFKRWPGLKRFQDEVVARCERDGALTNSFGYRLKFWNFKWQDGKRTLLDREEALALIPQSDVAFMSKVIMRPGEIEGCFTAHGGEFLLQNHDEFGGRVPRAALPEFYAASKKVIERKFPELGVVEPFGTFRSRGDFSTGWNWGKHHEHSEKCGGPPKCDKIENPGGLKEWKEAA